MQMEVEEDPWAGLSVEILPGVSTNVELQLTLRRELNELREERDEVDEDGDVRQNLSHEEERPTENVTGRKWGLPQGCSESRLQQVEIRVADEVLTILAETAVAKRRRGQWESRRTSRRKRMSSWHEERDKSQYKWDWRKQRGKRFWREFRRRK